ncbi:MAG: hypothetical protein WBX14_06370, partial [Candidatus Udaeobacter sp.]
RSNYNASLTLGQHRPPARSRSRSVLQHNGPIAKIQATGLRPVQLGAAFHTWETAHRAVATSLAATLHPAVAGLRRHYREACIIFGAIQVLMNAKVLRKNAIISHAS